MTGRRVVVALSGGVDSTVAAALLVAGGWDVVGATLRLAPCRSSGDPSGCCGPGAEVAAAEAARALGIPHVVLDAAATFQERVLRPAWEAYAAGRTPCPCARCNAEVKLGLLLPWAYTEGATHLATGHYARVATGSGGPTLLRAVDPERDQSWFLFALSPAVLEALLLPVGERTKAEVRALAAGLGLPNAGRADSQDACVRSEDGSFAEALRLRFGGEARPGVVVDRTGRVLGQHAGIHRYTVGQRRGLGVALGRPAWVQAVHAATGEVVVDTVMPVAHALVAERARWLGPVPTHPFRCSVQVRSRHRAAGALVEPLADGRFRARFDIPQRAVTPGQAAVCYAGDRVLGGGWITETTREG